MASDTANVAKNKMMCSEVDLAGTTMGQWAQVESLVESERKFCMSTWFLSAEQLFCLTPVSLDSLLLGFFLVIKLIAIFSFRRVQ